MLLEEQEARAAFKMRRAQSLSATAYGIFCLIGPFFHPPVANILLPEPLNERHTGTSAAAGGGGGGDKSAVKAGGAGEVRTDWLR